MNINDFVRNNTAAQALAYGAATDTNASSTSKVSNTAQAGLEKASQRIQSQVDTTTTQLSALGKLKSAVAGVQTAAQSLSQLATTAPNTPPASAATIKTALTNFVKAFNEASATASPGTSTTGKPGDSASTQAAARVARDLGKAVSADPTTAAALKQVGISVSPQGRLALDSAKLEVAQTTDAANLRASLAKIGQQLDATTTQELAQSGNVGSALASLNQTATVLKNQKAALAALGQSASAGSTLQRLGSLGFGLANYQNS